jgi:hypothetical protein
MSKHSELQLENKLIQQLMDQGYESASLIEQQNSGLFEFARCQNRNRWLHCVQNHS